MIKIVYGDLTAGLNGDAVRRGSDVAIVLVHGLTYQQRKAVLRRLRQAAGRGQKPPLPLGLLTFALAADLLRRWAGNLAAIVRLHPAGSLVPSFGAAALIVAFLMTSVSVHLQYGASGPMPQAAGSLRPFVIPVARVPGRAVSGPPGRSPGRGGTSGPGAGITLTASGPHTHRTARGSSSGTSAARSSASASSGASTSGSAGSGAYGAGMPAGFALSSSQAAVVAGSAPPSPCYWPGQPYSSEPCVGIVPLEDCLNL
jgi:hypothetical protein